MVSDVLTEDKTGGEIINGHEKKVVTVEHHGKCDPIDPKQWPSGEFLLRLCQIYDTGSELERAESHTKSLAASAGTVDQSEYVNQVSMQERWQASARRALLQQFGYVWNHLDSSRPNDGKKSDDLTFLPGEIEDVQRQWKKVVDEIVDQNVIRCINGEDCPMQKEISINRQDFIEFVLAQCSKSNNRQLQWSILSCPRGVQFPLHAHPNLELIYCLRGILFEIRMHGEPISRTFEEFETSDASESIANVLGPNLTEAKRSWSFGTLKTGQWLVNEVGSVHKSFTSVRSDGGCDLLVLWSGSHANILQPPITPNIQKAVDEMEDKLRMDDSCCMNSTHQIVPETFLPDSERS
jgi:hypothetical protein